MKRLLIAALALSVLGCGHREARRLQRASKDLGKAVKRGNRGDVAAAVVPGRRPTLDMNGVLAGTARRSWSKGLNKPQEVRPTAILFVGPDTPVHVVWTDEGWRFAEDPTNLYSQATPRAALRALVLASRYERWDVLIRLAPKRYRMGLSVEDLKKAWSEGEHAEVLSNARDKLAEHLSDPIAADAHEAVLDMGGGHVARLERESDLWVVVDFLPDAAK